MLKPDGIHHSMFNKNLCLLLIIFFTSIFFMITWIISSLVRQLYICHWYVLVFYWTEPDWVGTFLSLTSMDGFLKCPRYSQSVLLLRCTLINTWGRSMKEMDSPDGVRTGEGCFLMFLVGLHLQQTSDDFYESLDISDHNTSLYMLKKVNHRQEKYNTHFCSVNGWLIWSLKLRLKRTINKEQSCLSLSL